MAELSHLDQLEAEAIYIIREVAAECEKPVMLYSIGKDSSVMLHLAMKAFYPEKPPFPFLHVNTTWKFKEMIKFRDETAKKLGIEMLEYINEDGVKKGINPFDYGSVYTDIMKTQALKQALNKYGFTAAFGGGRRDEEKSRAKERIFSFRNENHAWDPKNQRPEMWKLYNSRINKGESIRVFPISNWTETDIWQYIKRENIDIVPLYFADKRPVVERDGMLIMVDDDRFKLREGEKIEYKNVRFRTLGCYPLTGGVESNATTLDEIIYETLSAVSSERTTRVIDNEAAGSMERRKRERGISKMIGLLKFITCGSVDDGKSTLIGHILYDSKLLYADQEKALELDSKVGSRGGAIDYSLLLDGLMAEREQGITIDVAYRYFTTDKRSFIVADTPGHEEYTRNMAVGASFADLAIILIDAKQGVLVQTKRHARICALMGIKYFVFAVNKMDLVGYSEERFNEITKQIDELSKELGLASVKIIPVSATEGDNITVKSDNTPWYSGEALLTYLENADVSEKKKEEGFYMPVQRVCRPDHTFRGFQGQIESGVVSVGDDIITLPSGESAKVKSILVGDKDSQSAQEGQPATIQLDKEVDVSRGCVLSSGTTLPVSKSLTATILWMDDAELTVGKDYIVKIGTKQVLGVLKNIQYKIDVNTGNFLPANGLSKNEIAVCDIGLQEAVIIDEFAKHKTLGELILIDRISNMTSACGVVTDSSAYDNKEVKCAFVNGSLKGNADIFEEYYYNLESATVTKVSPSGKTYKVGDVINVSGETYSYPDNFDVIVLRDKVAVTVRDKKIEAITKLEEYTYTGTPVINSRGFEIRLNGEDDYNNLINDLNAIETANKPLNDEFFNKWTKFDTYRKIIFKDEVWEYVI